MFLKLFSYELAVKTLINLITEINYVYYIDGQSGCDLNKIFLIF